MTHPLQALLTPLEILRVAMDKHHDREDHNLNYNFSFLEALQVAQEMLEFNPELSEHQLEDYCSTLAGKDLTVPVEMMKRVLPRHWQILSQFEYLYVESEMAKEIKSND